MRTHLFSIGVIYRRRVFFTRSAQITQSTKLRSIHRCVHSCFERFFTTRGVENDRSACAPRRLYTILKRDVWNADGRRENRERVGVGRNKTMLQHLYAQDVVHPEKG